MKNVLLLLIILVTYNFKSYANNDIITKEHGVLIDTIIIKKTKYVKRLLEDPKSNNTLDAAVNFNFAGKSGLGNFMPSVFYGWEEYLNKKDAKFKSSIRLGPTISSPIPTKDSVNYLAALMSRGNLGLSSHFFLEKKIKHITIKGGPGFGLKFIGNFGKEDKTVTQHNFNIYAYIKFYDNAILSCQYFWGAHNSTYEAKKNFEDIFSVTNSRVKYYDISLQTKLTKTFNNVIKGETKSQLYLLISYKKYSGSNILGNLPYDSFFSIGLVNSLSMNNSLQK